MITIIGVRFRNVGKVYYFSPRELDICVGDHVIVETARGVEYGFVVLGPKEVDDSKVIQPLKEVIRIATPKDDAREESNRKKEKEAFEICQKKIRAHNLEMKLIDAEYTFDNNKMLFYFTADGRIDFRELVKDLAAVFKPYSAQGSNCVRSVSAMRRKFLAESESAEDRSAAIPIFRSLHRFRSRWRRNRICP